MFRIQMTCKVVFVWAARFVCKWVYVSCMCMRVYNCRWVYAHVRANERKSAYAKERASLSGKERTSKCVRERELQTTSLASSARDLWAGESKVHT